MTWTCEHRHNLPDFLIIGAMKSGTTSLHHLLASHPEIFIPDGEIFFFTLDDIEQQPDSFIDTGSEWTFHDLDRNFDRYFEWYRKHFQPADPTDTIGEDSTTYLPSHKAPERIASLLPDVKLIALLRDPVDRAYSHYWHIVRKGIAMFDFETTLERCPGRILNRSMYRPSIERYRRHFSDEQLKVVVFERFVENQRTVLEEICEFLGVSPDPDLEFDQSHQNEAKVPLSPPLKRWISRVFRRRMDHFSTPAKFRNHPNTPTWWRHQIDRGLTGVASTLFRNRVTAKLSRMVGRSDYPPMNPRTRAFLEKLFEKENRGLSELIGTDVSKYWPYFDE